MAAGSIIVDLLMRTGSFETDTKRAASAAKKGATDIERAFDKMGRQITSVLATVGVTKFFIDSARAATAFEKQVAEIGTLLSDKSGLKALSTDLREVNKQFGGELSQQSKALYDIFSAGAKSSAEAISTLTAANKLAVGGVTSVSIAADGLTSILNAYSAQGITAQEASDALFVAMKGGKTTIEQLSSSLGQVSPLASSLGVSFDELTAAISAVTTGGVQTSIAVTQVRAVLQAILKPSEDAAKASKALGLNFNSSALQAKGLSGFLEDVAKKTGGSKEALARLFPSVEGLGAVLALTGSQATSFSKILEDQKNKLGATEAAYSALEQTASQKVARLRAAVEDSLVTIGEKFIAGTDAVDGLREAVSNPQLIDGIAKIAETLTRAGTAAVNFTNDVLGLAKTLGESLAASINGPALGDSLRIMERLAEVNDRLSRPIINRTKREQLEAERKKLEQLLALTEMLNRAANRAAAPSQRNVEDRGFVPTLPGANPLGDGPKKAKKEIDEVKKALDELEKELALFGQDDSFKKAFEFEGLKGLDKLGPTNAELERYRANLKEIARLEAAEEVGKMIKALEKQRNEFGLSADQLAIQELLLKGASQAQIEYAQSVIATTQALKDNKAIAEAKAAADDYLESIRRAQSAELLGFGKGNKERQRIGGRLGIEDKFEQQRRDLNRSRIDASLSGNFGPEQQRRYEQELEIIRSTQQQALEIYDNTFQKRLEMEADWSNGASEAAANYLDSIKDVSSQVNDAFTSAFQGMEDALVKFVTTGKLDFKSLADSILADITRIIIKQQIMAPLLGALGLGGGGGLFGGGSTGTFSVNGSPIGFRASGGPVSAGGSYIVGERGPEYFKPRTAGTVFSAKETAGMAKMPMSLPPQHFHFHGGTPDRRTADQVRVEAYRGATMAVRRGGA